MYYVLVRYSCTYRCALVVNGVFVAHCDRVLSKLIVIRQAVHPRDCIGSRDIAVQDEKRFDLIDATSQREEAKIRCFDPDVGEKDSRFAHISYHCFGVFKCET